MKKILVLSMVLVMALASFASAAVTFKGGFEATISQEAIVDGTLDQELNWFEGEFGVAQSYLRFNAEAAGEGYKFSARLNVNNNTGEVTVNRQKLELTDDMFDLAIWANSGRLGWKGTPFNIIRAHRDAAANEWKTRLTVKAIDNVTLTADYTDSVTLKNFAEVKFAGHDFGLAHQRDFGGATAENTDSVALFAKLNLKEMVGSDVKVDAVYGLTLENDDMTGYKASESYVYGLGLTANPTELVRARAEVVEGKQNWLAEGKGSNNNTDKRTIKADVIYRLGTDTVAYGDIFATDEFFNNNDAAIGVFVERVTGKLSLTNSETVDKLEAKATAPLLDNFVWALATAEYRTSDDVAVTATPVTTAYSAESILKLDANVRVAVTEQLGLQPYVTFWNPKDQDNAFKFGALVEYQLGKADLALEAYSTTASFKNVADDETKKAVTFTVTVGF